MTLTTITKSIHARTWKLILLFIFLDLASKYLVKKYLQDVLRIIPGVISFEKIKNPGIALGMFPWASRILPFLVPVGIGVVVFFFWRTSVQKKWEFYGYTCIIGGALGNLIDRLIDGTVTDFIRLDFLGRLFPYIFNVADIIICAGVGCIILQVFLDIRRNTNASDSS